MTDTLFVALLDANVLYPAPLRDFLLRLAETGSFSPRWSALIHQEWIQNLLKKRPDLHISSLKKAKFAMDSAFPLANVTGFQKLIPTLHLPDKNDRHVLAAAIHSKANAIITFNQRDFPQRVTRPYDLEAIPPDAFIVRMLKNNLLRGIHAFQNQVAALKHPPLTAPQVLHTLEKCGLPESTAILRKALATRQ